MAKFDILNELQTKRQKLQSIILNASSEFSAYNAWSAKWVIILRFANLLY